MKKRTILAAVALLILEFVIVYAILLIPESVNMPMNVRILDMVVLSIILWMISYDLFKPIINVDAKNPPEVGSLGIRWVGQIIYAVSAIAFAVVGVIFEIAFIYQLLGQLVLLAALLMVYFFAVYASDAVKKVAKKEETILKGRDQMRIALNQIQDEVAINPSLPEYFRADINELEEKLRYISPSDSDEAATYEKQFADIAGRVCIALSNFSMNEENIKQDVLRMKRAVENRKNVKG